MALDVKEAVTDARKHARELFTDERLNNLALEEVDFDENHNQWLITLGYDSPSGVRRKKSGPAVFPTVEEETKREYKVFRLDAETGRLISMKIRHAE